MQAGRFLRATDLIWVPESNLVILGDWKISWRFLMTFFSDVYEVSLSDCPKTVITLTFHNNVMTPKNSSWQVSI